MNGIVYFHGLPCSPAAFEQVKTHLPPPAPSRYSPTYSEYMTGPEADERLARDEAGKLRSDWEDYRRMAAAASTMYRVITFEAASRAVRAQWQELDTVLTVSDEGRAPYSVAWRTRDGDPDAYIWQCWPGHVASRPELPAP